jgi:hypothetical protein
MNNRTPVSGRSFLLLSLVLLPGLAGATDHGLDPARVGWSEIRMTASKFFLTAESRLALRTVSGATVTPDLLPVADPHFTPLVPGNEVLELVYDTQGAGRKSRLTLLMDPVTGAALQRVQHDQDRKPRFRTYRFGIEGAYHRTFWPATAAEKSLQPRGWTRTTEGLRAYPIPPGKHPVVEPTGLLYAIAAAALDKPGDTLELLVFRRRDTQTVRIKVLPSHEVSVRYDEIWPTGTVQRNGKVTAVRLSLQGLPVPGGDPTDDDLELLGLRGQLELLLDPGTRAPLQLSGDVKIFGRVTLRIAELHPR